MREQPRVAAVVLAAGRSQRMGSPKMSLPWGSTTVIGQVVDVLFAAGVEDIVVVTGGANTEVVEALDGKPVQFVHNPDYESGEMLSSLQVGLAALPGEVEAALVVLGDQPQIQVGVVKSILEAYRQGSKAFIVPSYQMHRGHPWLIVRSFWVKVFALKSPATLRDLLNRYSEQIDYVNVGTRSILQDLDTPEDYQRYRPDEGEFEGET